MDERSRVIRRRWLRLAIAGLTLGLLLALGATAFAQTLGPFAGPIVVGLPKSNETAYEFVGRIDQDGANFVGYGYLTYIHGLTNAQLFSDPNPLTQNESSAYFTFYVTATLTSRQVISNVFVLGAQAPNVTVYFNSYPNGNFSNPTSFRQAGIPVARYAARYQDILNVQSASHGIATNVGELIQQVANPFTLGTATYYLGQPGVALREWFTGEGVRTNTVDPPQSFVVGAGNTVLTGMRAGFLPLATRSGP